MRSLCSNRFCVEKVEQTWARLLRRLFRCFGHLDHFVLHFAFYLSSTLFFRYASVVCSMKCTRFDFKGRRTACPAVEPPCATISRQRPLILRILGGLLRKIQLYLENIFQQNEVLVSEKFSWSIVSGYEYLWLRKDRREDATVFIFGEYWFACILSQIDAILQEFRMHLPWIVQLITRKQPDWTGNWTSSPRRMSAIQRCFCFVFFFFQCECEH